MTARDIEIAITNPFAPFDRRRYLVVPNVSWGMNLTHECDLLAVTAAGFAHEIEIKVTLYDLKRDAGKNHHHSSAIIKCLWFAGPEALGPSLLQHAPPGSGVVVVKDLGTHTHCQVLRQPLPRPLFRKLTPHQRYQLARLGCIRYWDARATIERLVREKEHAHEPTDP